MKLFKCGTCDKILEEKYVNNHPASKITWLDATEHEDRIKEIDQMQNKSRRSEEDEKEKKIEAYKAELRDLDNDELDKVLESLRAELHELKKKLNPETDEEKQERDSKLEHIGVDSSLITNTRYHVLTLDQGYRDSKSGDKLLILMGSSDSDTVTDTSGDKLLQSLGSVD